MKRLAIPLCLALCAPAAGASGLAPDDVVALIAAELQKNGVAGEPVPPSRALPACDGKLTVTPMNGGWGAVTLGCDGPRWTRAIRLRDGHGASASSARPEPRPAKMVLGLNRAMAKDEVIAATDLVPVAFDDAAPDQIFAEPEQLIGRKLKQSLGPGKAVLARHLMPAHMVLADSPVVIMSQSQGFTVSLSGQAQSDAALGDFVDVIVASSGRRITARVIGQDLVRVTLKPGLGQP